MRSGAISSSNARERSITPRPWQDKTILIKSGRETAIDALPTGTHIKGERVSLTQDGGLILHPFDANKSWVR